MKFKRARFPITVKNGSCSVKIYRDDKPSGSYYRVAYYLGGKRQRMNFSTLEAAKAEAEAKVSQLARGDVDATQLTGRDRLVYGRALDAIRPLDVALDAAAIEYAAARKLLDGHSLVEAARFYMRHHGQGIRPKYIADAVDEMIAAKREKGVSEIYLSDLRYRLGVFKDRFQCRVHDLTPDDLAEFFASLRLSARSFNNFLTTLRTFLSHAKGNGWLSKEADPLATVEKRKQRAVPVEIFTAAEITTLLAKASDDLRPALAIAAFAGLRMEEILRLTWNDTRRRPGYIEIEADKAKTARRRLVPIADNLARWLAVAKRNTGKIWPHSKPYLFESVRNAADAAKVEWKTNALRHSFITYRLAEIQKVDQVALEAGNSAQMIFMHYRELAVPEQAEAWFAVSPEPAHRAAKYDTR